MNSIAKFFLSAIIVIIILGIAGFISAKKGNPMIMWILVLVGFFLIKTIWKSNK